MSQDSLQGRVSRPWTPSFSDMSGLRGLGVNFEVSPSTEFTRTFISSSSDLGSSGKQTEEKLDLKADWRVQSPSEASVEDRCQSQKDYEVEVTGRLSSLGLFVDLDNGDNTLPKKIRNGEIAQYNFILVVGQEELDTALSTYAIRMTSARKRRAR
ncbi:hypothetical protein GALMADRAFT_137781 [Galerina marginata CBS 339.88]|uniref:Anticodon-binding domain-containing protein n=1 Tax=Galerina marginata (strain CBS 339.88) TaxID=685588 RepID=A0A067T6E9_GALM3|nr:hypothetical protein GALMADRAFT_137781 [Galerina marginata CBS 339.88]